jgi:tryptophanyl-tRNA synthetase
MSAANEVPAPVPDVVPEVAGVTAESKVTPWDVEGAVDYDKLIRDFGSSPIDQAMLDRMERLTGKKPHPFLRRGIFFSHRDFGLILDYYEKKQPWYLYTGRGPSSESMHMGHLIPFMFTKWLQETFQVPLVIQMTDDEKFLWKDLSQDEVERMTSENIKDVIAMGFDPNLTFIFRNFDYLGNMYRVIARIQKATTASQARGIFGFKMEDCIGKWAFPAIQAAPSFSAAFPQIFPQLQNYPCLIPCAIDQDPYFRMTRDIAPRLGWLKPALLHSKFFPALQGNKTKMSASNTMSAVFLTDTEKQIKDKINSQAFSGGGATKLEQMQLGANSEVDVAVQWLRFFLDDDVELARLTREYETGRAMSGEIKKRLVACLWGIVHAHQERRKTVTDEELADFCRVRPLAPTAEWMAAAEVEAKKRAAEAEAAAATAKGGKKDKKAAKAEKKEKEVAAVAATTAVAAEAVAPTA